MNLLLFIPYTLYRYLGRNPSEPRPCIDVVHKLTDLPTSIRDAVYKLSTLAFEGLQNDKLVFDQKEIDHLFPVSKAVNGFGLLQAVEHYPSNAAAGTTTSVNFLHYTMQEYLAALHVSTLDDKEQLKLMKKFWNGHYRYMWMMYVGIVGTKSEVFNTFISKGQKNKKGGIKLLGSITKDKKKLLHLFQCYSEGKGIADLPNIITSMFKGGKIKFEQTLLPHDLSSLVSFLSHSKVNLSALELHNCHFGDTGMNILKHFIVNNKELVSTLGLINLQENDTSPWDVYCTVIEHCHIGSLTIFGDSGMEEHIKQLQSCLEKNKILQSLTLYNIGKVGLQSIKTVIASSKLVGLKEINVSWLNHDVKKAQVLLHTTLSLNHELLHSNVSKEIAIKVLWDGTSNCTSDLLNMSSKLGDNIDILWFIEFGLQNNKTVCKLDLSNNSECLSNEEGITFVCDWLKSNNTLQELSMSGNCIGNKVQIIAKALQSNNTLQKLDISSNNISDDDVETDIYTSEVNNRECEADMSAYRNAVTISTSHCNLPRVGIKTGNVFQISKLNISNNHISSTVISSYIKNNTFLQELNISEMAITNEGAAEIAKAIETNSLLHELDISKNYITTEGLLCLFKAGGLLKVLNVTHNNVTKSGFEKIECLLKLSLFRVNASWNEIVFENEQLKFKSAIYVFSNSQKMYSHDIVLPITDIKDVNRRVEFLSNCLKEDTTLRHLDLCNKNINGVRAKVVAKAIETNTALQKLNVSCNALSNEGTLAFAECLKINKNLQELLISENNITNDGATMIAEAMKVNTTLLKLDVSKNWIGLEALLCLLKAIKNNAVLHSLNVTHNNVAKSEFIKIHDYIKQISIQVQVSWNEIKLNSELQIKSICKSCNTDDNDITDNWPLKKIPDPVARMEFLSNCLKENNTLQNLNLRKNGITDIGATLIAQAIENNQTLKILDVSQNKLSDDGVTAISIYLRNNNCLQQLDLSDNEISVEGANKIGELVQSNTSLKELDISSMCICDDGVKLISKCLKNNTSFQVLNLSLNKITGIGAKNIAEFLKENTTLRKLNITGNKISNDGAAAISNCCNCLQELNMSENNISNEGAKCIADAIQSNQCLHTLDLHHHSMDNSFSFNNTILDAVLDGPNDTLKQLKLPWVDEKYQNIIRDKVKTINKKRAKRAKYVSLQVT